MAKNQCLFFPIEFLLFNQVINLSGKMYVFYTDFFFNFYYFLAALHSMWDLHSPTRDPARTPCSGSAES